MLPLALLGWWWQTRVVLSVDGIRPGIPRERAERLVAGAGVPSPHNPGWRLFGQTDLRFARGRVAAVAGRVLRNGGHALGSLEEVRALLGPPDRVKGPTWSYEERQLTMVVQDGAPFWFVLGTTDRALARAPSEP